MAFTLIVLGVFVLVAAVEEPAEWVFFTPLLPLFLLLITGLYLFVLPYLARRRRGSNSPEGA